MTFEAKMPCYREYDTFLHNQMCHIKEGEQYMHHVSKPDKLQRFTT